MLKCRLIPVLFLRNGFLVRSEQFKIHQKLGFPLTQVERYNAWDVDELMYIDISPDERYDIGRNDLRVYENLSNILDIINAVSKKCFMPLTFGGRIRTLEDIHLRIAGGADKVTINTQAIEDPSFITAAAKEFGSQAIIVSIDAYRHEDSRYEVLCLLGKRGTGRFPHEWAEEAQDRGAGEIFLNSINRDGAACGYDLELISLVAKHTVIPIIACGGVGKYSDFLDGIDAGASAVAAGNIFHFKEMSYIMAKHELNKAGANVR
jgi:cyclase